MARIAWLTDIHLNFFRGEQLDEAIEIFRGIEADKVLIGGDIAESHNLLFYLARLDEELGMPIYFVLGNHDFYRGSIREVRAQVADFCRDRPGLCYLSADGIVELAPGVGLVGHDGWADARWGDYERSLVMMNDYQLIQELALLGKQRRWPVLQSLGDEAAAHVRRVLPEALDRYEHVVLLTHVPPVREACQHAGRLSDDEWVPHFTCKAMGDAILEIMAGRPERRLTVLCGHTHTRCECRPLENVEVLSGAAQYGTAQVERVFEF